MNNELPTPNGPTSATDTIPRSEPSGSQPAGTTSRSDRPSHTLIVDETMILGILCYLGPLVLIPFFMKREQPFITFHVKQGLVLFGLEVAFLLFGWILLFLAPVVWIGLLILTVFGVYHIITRVEQPLPIVGRFADYITLG